MKRPTAPATVRVAVYTRKSTEEGLDQEFNSLDSQRAAVEAFILSQREAGWQALPERYDDGGFTGANTDRPGFQRLLADIAAGRVDVVAVYKIDRLSRSLHDFVGLMKTFDKAGVTFVSVTQQFSTTTSIGKLTLNLLATFAEFEREVISERTRDKIHMTRRKGHYTGGRPILGFDVVEKRLVVNATEAPQVREMFGLYLELRSLSATAAELTRRGIRQKLRTTRKGLRTGGKPFDKPALSYHLHNVVYAGRVKYKRESFPGIHERIVDDETFDAVQRLLRQHGRSGGGDMRNRYGVLLRGILRCGVCGAGMSHHWTCRGEKRWSFYVCEKALRGRAADCRGSRVSVPLLEREVVNHLRDLGTDPDIVRQVLAASRADAEAMRPSLEAERRRAEGRLATLRNERENLLAAIAQGTPGTRALTERLGAADTEAEDLAVRLHDVRNQLAEIDAAPVAEHELRAALAAFDPVWHELFPREKARVLALLLEHVTVNVPKNEVSLTFRPSGVRALSKRRT